MNYKYFFNKDAHKDFKDPLVNLINLLEKEIGITPYLRWLMEERMKTYIVSPPNQYFTK